MDGNAYVQLQQFSDFIVVLFSIGYNVMDNGFAQFDNVKIPRRNMAMRFAHVDERGRYSKKSVSAAASKISYITMMQVRAHICNEAGKNLAVACTIVTRYSALRRQGYASDGESELQILDYKQQQHRVFPLIAASYCFFFTGKRVMEQLKDIEDKLVSNKSISKAAVTDIHASSSALKSFTTTVAADGIEDCRKACGGHGFLQCSGLPELITTYLQSPTVEGDNQMLPQQVVKVLLKLVQTVQDDGDLSDYVSCDSYGLISSLQSILKGVKEDCRIVSEIDVMKLDALLAALCHRSARLLVGVASQIQGSISSGKSYQEAWNDALVEMARVSRAYSQFLLLRNFMEGIDGEERSGAIGVAEVTVLQNLARLFALYWMEKELGDFLEDGYVTADHSRWVRSAVLQLLDCIRTDAVSLVDARDFSDFKLKSALGRYDGDVYPAILKAALRDPLNHSDPGPGYEQHLKRLIAGGAGTYKATVSRL
jgi:acyl-CoA oxidase